MDIEKELRNLLAGYYQADYKYNELALELDKLIDAGLDDISQDKNYVNAVAAYKNEFNNFIIMKFRNEFLSTELGKKRAENLIAVIKESKNEINKAV